MKTPIQELIDEMNEMLVNGDGSIYALREKARLMLKKEKEFMQKVYANAKATGEMDEAVRTFNTKENDTRS